MENSNNAPGKSGLRTAALIFFTLGAAMSAFTPFLLWYAVNSFGGGTGVSLLYVVGILMAFSAWLPVLISFILTVVLTRREGRKMWWQKFNLILLVLWASAGILALSSLR